MRRLRLIAGATTPSGKQRVGVEIVMAPGYKTYWRSPGDFGVPPRVRLERFDQYRRARRALAGA